MIQIIVIIVKDKLRFNVHELHVYFCIDFRKTLFLGMYSTPVNKIYDHKTFPRPQFRIPFAHFTFTLVDYI